MFNNNTVYVVFRCPICKGLGEKYPPGKYDAVSDKDIYRCADCGETFIIKFTPLTRVVEQRDAPVRDAIELLHQIREFSNGAAVTLTRDFIAKIDAVLKTASGG